MPKDKGQQKEDRSLKVLMPGTKLENLQCGVTATVYPMGFVHMREFASDLVAAFNAVARVAAPDKPRNDTKEERQRVEREFGERLIKSMAPMVTTQLLDVVARCVTFEAGVTMDQVPHYDVPVIVEAWIMESFGTEDKWRPWLATMERLLTHFSGKEVRILEMLSKPSSPQDTPSPT